VRAQPGRNAPGFGRTLSVASFSPLLRLLSRGKIDPNVHSCGTVYPHGVDELAHPETNLFLVGMKSYGRAPTFLALTGYEQVRSIVAALTGDWESARRVELVLPETGVCSTDLGGTCGMPAKDGTASCCSPASSAPSLELVQVLPTRTRRA
jgi:hypothetical protein